MFLRPRGQNKSNPFFAAATVVSADSQALFAPANRDTSSKAPRCFRLRRRFAAFPKAGALPVAVPEISALPYGGRFHPVGLSHYTTKTIPRKSFPAAEVKTPRSLFKAPGCYVSLVLFYWPSRASK